MQNFRARLAKKGLIDDTKDVTALPVRKWFPTENLPLDWVLGRGTPMGALWELFGVESSGKSTIAYSLAAHLQRTLDANVIVYETEDAIDDAMIIRTQLDMTKTVRAPEEFTDCIASVVNHMVETALEYAELQKAGDVEDTPLIFIWDSVGGTSVEPTSDALTNKRGTFEAGISVARMAAMASQLTVALPHIKKVVHHIDATAIFINQAREDMDVSYVSRIRTPGGKAFRHFADVRTQVAKSNPHKSFMSGKSVFTKADTVLGAVASIEAVKNKLAAPYKKVALVNWFATGIDNAYSSIIHAIFDLCDYEIVGPIVKARCEYAGKNWYPQELARAFKEDRGMWEEFAERVRAAQADKDVPITPTVEAFKDYGEDQDEN